MFYKCPLCGLVFADPADQLDRTQEKLRYDCHENNPADEGYRNFLRQLADPLLQKLTPGQSGLDFGCGPGPTLSGLLEDAGMHMSLYDPFYAPDQSVLNQQYDFVTCSEVVEHFNHPLQSWQQLTGLVRPGGWLGVMTSLFTPRIDFASWHYPKDLTHVCFYSPQTLDWLADRFSLTVEAINESVILFQSSHSS